LRSYMQHLASAVKFRDGCRRNRVGHIGPVSQPPQDAGVDKNGHYLYSPSLLRAESGTDTPQSMADPNSFRSQSSRGSTGGTLGRNRSRKASIAKISGATPRWRACSLNAASNCRGSMITIGSLLFIV